MQLVNEVRKLADSYVAKGGKQNRKQQRKRMLALAVFCAKTFNNKNLDNVGKYQVIQFWKKNKGLAKSTRYNYFCAFRILWKLAGKSSVPPEPF